MIALCAHCKGAGRIVEPCAICDGKGWALPEGFTAGHNCSCSNLRCIKCGGSGTEQKKEPIE